MDSVLLDVAGHRRSPAKMPGNHRGRPPRNKGEHYPADPPTVEEIVAVMRTVGDRPDGQRLRALVVLLWRAGLRISEALALQETDLDDSRGAILVRRGKGGLCCIRHRSPIPAETRSARVGANRICAKAGGNSPAVDDQTQRHNRGDQPLLLRRCDEHLIDVHKRPRIARIRGRHRRPLILEESGTEVGFGEIEEVSILSLPGTGCEVGRAGCDGPSLGVWTDASTDGGAAAELVL